MKTINCIIVEDEPLAMKLIEAYVRQTPFLTLKASCSSAIEAIQYLNSDEAIELVFLDIQMPDLSGLDFSKTLKPHIRIIFTTAFEQYALEGYKVNAIGYLLKPFDYSEFLAAANKALQQINQQEDKVPGKQISSSGGFIFVKSEYKQVKISLDDILYIEGLKDYVKIMLRSQDKPVLTLMSLKKFEEELPGEQFMRVHRSFIIALDKIDAIERSQVLIRNERITVAPQYKDAFEAFMRNKLL
ncbi:MAG: response regulator transcription factor [Taibaiella sp.]|nr:response regulator transcription factor [Taibaiella sp.]